MKYPTITVGYFFGCVDCIQCTIEGFLVKFNEDLYEVLLNLMGIHFRFYIIVGYVGDFGDVQKDIGKILYSEDVLDINRY